VLAGIESIGDLLKWPQRKREAVERGCDMNLVIPRLYRVIYCAAHSSRGWTASIQDLLPRYVPHYDV
jgi:hypothetical protein